MPVFGHLFGSFYRVTGNAYNDIVFRFAQLEHAEFCLESAIHDIHCHLSGTHCPNFSSDEKKTHPPMASTHKP